MTENAVVDHILGGGLPAAPTEPADQRVPNAHYILGIDPGLASFGYALTTITTTDISVVSMGTIRTKKDKKKANVLASEDNWRRCVEIAMQIRKLIDGLKIVALCGESMSFPRNSSAAAKVAMTWGISADITAVLGVPMLQASPQRIKSKLCGNYKASKEEVQQAIIKQFPGVNFDSLLEHLPAGEHEHPWDALAAVITCLDAEPIRMVRRLLA
jgi:crossover junction endodeoxyribonuclease RuvC